MKSVSLRVAIGAMVIVGCGQPAAPEIIDIPDDLVPVTLVQGDVRAVNRAPEPPRVTLDAVSGGVRFQVTRAWLCAMLGSAGYRVESVGSSTMTIVASVSANPAALCAAMVGEQDYSGTVPATPGRSYDVRFYEQVADGPARLLATRRVIAQ